jgi:hypothetical protein
MFLVSAKKRTRTDDVDESTTTGMSHGSVSHHSHQTPSHQTAAHKLQCFPTALTHVLQRIIFCSAPKDVFSLAKTCPRFNDLTVNQTFEDRSEAVYMNPLHVEIMLCTHRLQFSELQGDEDMFYNYRMCDGMVPEFDETSGVLVKVQDPKFIDLEQRFLINSDRGLDSLNAAALVTALQGALGYHKTFIENAAKNPLLFERRDAHIFNPQGDAKGDQFTLYHNQQFGVRKLPLALMDWWIVSSLTHSRARCKYVVPELLALVADYEPLLRFWTKPHFQDGILDPGNAGSTRHRHYTESQKSGAKIDLSVQQAMWKLLAMLVELGLSHLVSQHDLNRHHGVRGRDAPQGGGLLPLVELQRHPNAKALLLQAHEATTAEKTAAAVPAASGGGGGGTHEATAAEKTAAAVPGAGAGAGAGGGGGHEASTLWRGVRACLRLLPARHLEPHLGLNLRRSRRMPRDLARLRLYTSGLEGLARFSVRLRGQLQSLGPSAGVSVALELLAKDDDGGGGWGGMVLHQEARRAGHGSRHFDCSFAELRRGRFVGSAQEVRESASARWVGLREDKHLDWDWPGFLVISARARACACAYVQVRACTRVQHLVKMSVLVACAHAWQLSTC